MVQLVVGRTGWGRAAAWGATGPCGLAVAESTELELSENPGRRWAESWLI
jgi:hypothetical protein